MLHCALPVCNLLCQWHTPHHCHYWYISLISSTKTGTMSVAPDSSSAWYPADAQSVHINQHTLISPSVRSNSVNPKETQSWIFIGRTDAIAKAPILWPPDMNSWLIGKDPELDTVKDWGQEDKGVTKDEMVGWHHQLNGQEFEQTWEMVEDREAWRTSVHGLQRAGHNLATKQQHTHFSTFTYWITWLMLKVAF